MRKMQIMIIAFFAVFLLGIADNTQAATIGNTVWSDQNQNGVQDPDENGISGVRIKLYNGNDVETDKTNSKGRYEFDDLDAGHYTLIVAQETLPNGCVATYDRDGNKDGKYSDKYLKVDDSYTHADFGYYCPTKTTVVVAKTSPVTGPNSTTAIIATIMALMMAMIAYKYQNGISAFIRK
ncbi:MAG: SdrD B-like domain-containing protein [Patescibacteria group bacterium]|nr:SdrD B-like domain-containing protein [Patescibacteria group bacterium]